MLERSLGRALTLVALCLPFGCAGREDDDRPVVSTPEGDAIIGVGFEPIATRTRGDAAQTVAHMELTGLLFLPGDRGLLTWEKSGRVVHYTLERDSLVLEGEFHLDDIETFNDCGLISLALDPEWEQNGYLYTAACKSRTHSVVKRYTFHGDDYDAVAESGVKVIDFGDADATKAWHNVGSIGFFPDAERSMWILVGDKNIRQNAQDMKRNLGAMLRIVPDRTDAGGYEPHPDNPFGGPGSDPERQSSPDLYAWGFRSPWRGAIDADGRVWIGDVGNGVEEINLAREPGQNFGWGELEGRCQDHDDELRAKCEHMVDPIVSWHRGSDHPYRVDDELATPSTKRVAWVGTPYRVSEHDPYHGFFDDGAALVSDMCIGFVRAVAVDSDGHLVRDDFVGHFAGLSGSVQGPDGYLYVTVFGGCTSATFGVGGGIYRVVPRTRKLSLPSVPEVSDRPLADDPFGAMPFKLSQTGLFEDLERLKPVERAIRYEPAWPLWTNGSSKRRFLLLPEGTTIDNSDRARWSFPEGTLFVKTFGYPGKARPDRVETRILRKGRAGWEYHVYKWSGDDADLLPLEQRVPVQVTEAEGKKFMHQIPSRFECRSCHESNVGEVIGFDELNLNTPLDQAGPSQLAQLAERGVFAHPVPEDPDRVQHPDERTREVLGYMHGNCAHCHNSGPSSMSALDLHHGSALGNLVGVPTEGSGQAAGVRVVPGDPELSILFLAFSGRGDRDDVEPMPPIGVQRRDRDTIELVRSWIAGLSGPVE